MATRYGHRPSQLLALNDPAVALDFDLAVALVGARLDAKLAMEEARRIRHGGGGKENPDNEKKFWGEINKVRRIKGLPPIKQPIR